MNRRRFLNSGTKFAVGAMLLGTAELMQAQQQPTVRKSINGLSAADPIVKNYTKAVDLMRKLPLSDPRNWTQQANIHNNFCPHDNWWFLPWHRAYLFYFESICRDVLQDSTFTLPYWDWTRYSQIPAPFLDKSSPLWDSSRAGNGNIQLGPEIVGIKVISEIVGSSALVDLFSSPTTTDDQRQHMPTGTLEGTPHNGVHATILGDMGGYMSPLDPIFWLHHCNVDRIWASWSRQNNNLAPTAGLWTNHALARYYDPINKQQVSPHAGDTLDANKYRALYDKLENRTAAAFVPSVLSLRTAMLEIEGQSTHGTDIRQIEVSRIAGRDVTLGAAQQFRLDISPTSLALIQKSISPISAQAARTATTYLQVENVPPPSVPSTAMRVFLNCKDPTLNTSLDDPTYVGTVAFFGGMHGISTQSGVTFTMNATATLSKVVRAGLYSAGAPIDVAILPVDLANPKRSAVAEVLKPGSVRLVGLEAM